MSGDRVTFVGDAMAAVVQGIAEAHALIGRPPVVVGGLAVLARLSNPYRATVDLDVVDRRQGPASQLEVLRAGAGAEPLEPAAVLLQTRFGPVKIDVLEVRQIELDRPSDDPGDRLYASARAWAHDTATDLTIEVLLSGHSSITVTTLVAEPGPLIAMKLQAVENRSSNKQGTDLLDIVRLLLDPATRPPALAQITSVAPAVAHDMALHVDL
ncbi:prevent-host-death protein [Dermatophilaceae bacterium Soc4.6]